MYNNNITYTTTKLKMAYTPNYGSYIAAQPDLNFPPLPPRQMPSNSAFSQPAPLQDYPQNTIVYSSQPQNNNQYPAINLLTSQASTHIPNSNPKYQWQQISYSRKRSRSHEEFEPSNKQEYWLGDAVTVNSRYSALSQKKKPLKENPQTLNPNPHPYLYQVSKI
jgi:hypothetical protein